MVSSVASRVITRPRVSKTRIVATRKRAERMIEISRSAEVPLSVEKIPYCAGDYTDNISDANFANASIRPMGTSRRVFLLNPYLDAQDFEGLAHRIRALSKNEGINSLLIATDDQNDYCSANSTGRNTVNNNCLPRFLTNRNKINFSGVGLDIEPEPNHTWYVAGGYDAVQIPNVEDNEHIDYLLESLRKLSVAVHGSGGRTKIPTITLPHGAITDGGYALCMGSYVLATAETSLSILNPSRGLSLDPIGFSYILPRLGLESKKSKANYGCGMIMALTGYEANCEDMVETGLATHLISDSGILPILEEELATLPTWKQQGLVHKPRKFYGENGSPDHQNRHLHQQNYLQKQLQRNPNLAHAQDVNRKFRNRTIAHLIDQISDVAADSSNEFPFDYTAIYEDGCDDASLDTDSVPYDEGFFCSRLVSMAADLEEIFNQEQSLEGLVELLNEEAAKLDSNSATPIYAKKLVNQIEQQSPLALRVIYELMTTGSSQNASMENCMDREGKVQRKLMTGTDFRNWQRHIKKFGGDHAKAPLFQAWKHSNIQEVTKDEVDELLS